MTKTDDDDDGKRMRPHFHTSPADPLPSSSLWSRGRDVGELDEEEMDGSGVGGGEGSRVVRFLRVTALY